MNERLLILSAPSGAGKTTIARFLLDRFKQLEFSVSACSRSPRAGEIDGKDYYFIDTDTFKQKIANNQFVEWEEVYPGHFYGTLWDELRRIWDNGHLVVFDVDVKGALNLKKKFPNNSLSVFIMPPSVDVLRQRLQQRGTETPEKIEMRVSKAEKEMESAKQFDFVLVNSTLSVALAEAESVVGSWLAK